MKNLNHGITLFSLIDIFENMEVIHLKIKMNESKMKEIKG